LVSTFQPFNFSTHQRTLKVEAGDEEIDSFDFALMKMNEKE